MDRNNQNFKINAPIPLRSKREITEAEEKPARTAVNFGAIPAALSERSQWVLWKWVKAESNKDGVRLWAKIPHRITGAKAKPNDATTWAPFHRIKIAFEANQQFDGVGYVFAADDPFTGIDLDSAIDLSTGALKPWAAKIVTDFDTFTDISPTNTGAKLFVAGKKPAGVSGCKRPFHDGEIEVYDHCRFYTVTGQALPGTAPTIRDCPEQIATLCAEVFGEEKPKEEAQPPNTDLDDEEIIRRASRAKNGAQFSALWQGSTDGYPSDSEADLALLSHLGWWTQYDAGRMDRLFRLSGRNRDKWESRQDYRERSIKKVCEGKSGGYEPARCRPSRNGFHARNGEQNKQSSSKFAAGGLTFQPGKPRQTNGGKICVPVNTIHDGAIVLPFTITTTPSSRKEPLRVIRQLLGDDADGEQIDKVLTAILADGAQRLSAGEEVRSGDTVFEILNAKVPEALQLACRTPKGLWSERRGGEISRNDFVTFTTPELVADCGAASDAPVDARNVPVRSELIRLIQLEMGVVWAHLLNTLPPAQHVDLGQNTERGRAFRQAMIALWTRTQTFEIVKAHESTHGEIASRASFISRVHSGARDYLGDKPRSRPQPREKWRDIQRAFDGWWRPWEDTEGQTHILLAMRWTLAAQGGVELPGVTDQDSLTRLGERFGVIQTAPPVSSHFNRGKGRLAVLAIDLAEELLSVPQADEDREPGQEG